ncbi:MAG TPA: hypothetical protein VJQ83_03530 [Tepidiformaceae bacterium]|nr:hypothetical protein [Tepidiformaceae bacterium]
MADQPYQELEAWHTSVRLAAAVGRLRIGSNLKASTDAQSHAFEHAGEACALIAEAASREGGAQVGMFRDARGALAQCRAWLHILAAVTNEQDSVFANELDLADQASRQVNAQLRVLERANPRPPTRGAPPPGPRGAARPSGGPR